MKMYWIGSRKVARQGWELSKAFQRLLGKASRSLVGTKSRPVLSCLYRQQIGVIYHYHKNSHVTIRRAVPIRAKNRWMALCPFSTSRLPSH